MIIIIWMDLIAVMAYISLLALVVFAVIPVLAVMALMCVMAVVAAMALLTVIAIIPVMAILISEWVTCIYSIAWDAIVSKNKSLTFFVALFIPVFHACVSCVSRLDQIKSNQINWNIDVVVVVVMVAVDPRNLPSKFGQNRIWNNCDIDGIEFPVVDGGG